MSELENNFKKLEEYVVANKVGHNHNMAARRFLMNADQSKFITSVPTLLSVEKLKSLDELYKRGVKYGECYLQPKYDGVSVQAVYFYTGKKHRLLFGGTRKGKNCTFQLSQIIPMEIDYKSHEWDHQKIVVLRGELVMKDKTFFPGFVSPRTAATSYINTQYPRFSERYTVKWFDMYDVDNDFNAVKRNIGTQHTPYSERTDKQSMTDFYNHVLTLPEFCDGIILKAKNIKGYSSTAKFPKWSAAFKYPSETAETIVTNIYLTTGKTGRVTPVIEFEPVLINGATIAKASGGSEDVLLTKGIAIGSRIIVELAGQTIPHIKEVL